MPIREIRETDLEQECIRCGAVLAVAFTELQVGAARSSQIDSKIIPMPACPTCGACEYLIRSPDNEEYPTPGSYGHLHRILVDLLHARLVKAGRVVSGLDAKIVPLREPSQEVIDRWFGKGLKLSRPAKTDGQSQATPAVDAQKE